MPYVITKSTNTEGQLRFYILDEYRRTFYGPYDSEQAAENDTLAAVEKEANAWPPTS